MFKFLGRLLRSGSRRRFGGRRFGGNRFRRTRGFNLGRLLRRIR